MVHANNNNNISNVNALNNNPLAMFNYYWDDFGGYIGWNEDSLESLFKFLAKRELADMV